MMMWIEVIYLVASFVVHLKLFAQRVTRRIEPARYEGRETPDADSTKGFVNSGVSTIRKVDSDNLRF